MTATNTLLSRLSLTILLFALAPAAHALTPGEVFAAVKDSVVVVKTLDTKGNETGFGSGVILPSGKVGTNCHVIEGGASFLVGRNKTFLPATLDAGDRDKDICLLDAPGLKGRAAQLGKAAGLKVGETVYAVGAPQGLELSLSNGIVSQLRGDKAPLIQTTAAISPGSSGGGLFDAQARLVGFTTLYIEGAQSLNFAVPVEWLADIKPGRKPVAKARGSTDWLTRASALEAREDWSVMLDWCRQWTKAEPGNGLAWGALGNAYAYLKRYDDAIEAYRQALRVNPEYAEVWYNLGYAYAYLKRYDDAIEAYRQALRVNPEYAAAWYNLGNAYANLNRDDDAIESYRQALRVNPELALAWYNLGYTYADLKRYDDAIEAYRQALRLSPEDAVAWYNLGIGYNFLGNKSAALDAVKQLRRLDPAKADELFSLIVPR
jgi:cytochrome c-type biogenesis protein CcmH/NrfG